MVTRNKSANDTAEKHGDERYNDETLLQFHKTEEIQDECLGVFTRQGLKNAKDNLVNLGLISLHSNPNPRYKFDKTTFFLLHTGKLNEML
jgi:fido (protein-threonine AMPylation protein)